MSREDCARACPSRAAHDGHERESYDITGSEALTQAKWSPSRTRSTARRSSTSTRTTPDFAVDLAAAVSRQPAVELIVSVGAAGLQRVLPEGDDDVRALTGRDPVTVREVLERDR